MAGVDFEYRAMRNAKDENCAVVYALLALGQEVGRVAAALEQAVRMLKEAEGGPDTHLPSLPCNEMGGGSAGLDTAGDFAMHCDKPDKHDGPHSYEEATTTEEVQDAYCRTRED